MPSNRNSPQTQTSLLDEQDLDRQVLASTNSDCSIPQLVVASTKRRKTTQRTPANRVNKGKERAVTTDQEVLGPQASILILPNEVLLSIIEYTNPTAKTLCGLGKTCKRLNNLVSMDLFWRPIVATMYKPYTICLSESALPPSSSFSSTAAPSFSSSFSSSSASSSSLSLLFPLSSVTAISSSSAAPVFFGAAPNTGCRQFLADLAASMFCFRCGDGAETSLHVGLV
ncbi:hypothetical protein BC936DRAFT_145930 [Jimgerdemannia flammicorona]|uniref:F-box domain-containing protein n=1 Tax=Jimgerdemannia flammicorona TaxID=994334 RepID=A0A433D8W4_9FUNG|nr:hypothetical protein BC936DRAFT_145930 [Jimgerdemannia flammicorona]